MLDDLFEIDVSLDRPASSTESGLAFGDMKIRNIVTCCVRAKCAKVM